jgi:hypothetical protein
MAGVITKAMAPARRSTLLIFVDVRSRLRAASAVAPRRRVLLFISAVKP